MFAYQCLASRGRARALVLVVVVAAGAAAAVVAARHNHAPSPARPASVAPAPASPAPPDGFAVQPVLRVPPAQRSRTVHGRPAIAFDEATFDFGTVNHYDVLKHRFAFRNTGDQTLVVKGYSLSCQCAEVQLSKLRLSPGETGSVDIVFTPESYHGPTQEMLFVYTNDPEMPVSVLTFAGTVRIEVEAIPGGVYLGDVRQGETVRREVQLRKADAPAFLLTGVEARHEDLRARVAERTGDSYTVQVDFTARRRPGKFQSEVVALTNLTAEPRVRIPVYGKIVPRA